ncbi:DUF2092 domain-containing protein [Prosthecomicrobium sp. N25]|uniref:DUF2092 domain-containing protein n=1 Tax=Prosthecomicrobium sp. N25 TaxID=3129254 RepID=UPI003076A96C
MNVRVQLLSVALAAAFAVLPARAQDGAPEPSARDLALKSARYLAGRPALSFRWFVTYDQSADNGRKITSIRSGETLFSRKDGFFVKAEREGARRDYFYDGATFAVAAPDEKFYVSVPFGGGYDALVEAIRDKTGTVLPLWSILSEKLPDRLLEGVKDAAYHGTTLITGREVHHLSFRGADEDWQVWISTDEARPVPLMIVGVERAKRGAPVYRAYLSEWNDAPAVDPARFRFSPPADFMRLAVAGGGQSTKPATAAPAGAPSPEPKPAQ